MCSTAGIVMRCYCCADANSREVDGFGIIDSQSLQHQDRRVGIRQHSYTVVANLHFYTVQKCQFLITVGLLDKLFVYSLQKYLQ